MRVLVTGGRGLLGGATVKALTFAGHDVTVLQRSPSGTGVREFLGSVTDPAIVRQAMAGQEVVVHAAAQVSITGPWDEFESTNVSGTRILLDEARRAQVPGFVYVSSPSVAHAGHALIGAGAEPADPSRARGNYARSKAMAELAVLASDGDHLATCAIRPHLVWGPGDTQLVARIAERARSGRLALVGTGLALVDTTFVDNAADALVAAAERVAIPGVSGQAFVVSNGEPRPIGELVSRIASAAGARPPSRRVPFPVARVAGLGVERIWDLTGRTDEPPMTAFLAEQLATAHWFDQRQVRQALEWAPAIGLDEGFERLAAWFMT